MWKQQRWHNSKCNHNPNSNNMNPKLTLNRSILTQIILLTIPIDVFCMLRMIIFYFYIFMF